MLLHVDWRFTQMFSSPKHSHDMIACLGETTGLKSLQCTLNTMKESEEGTRILLEKPRINTKTVDIDALGRLPVDTFGFYYKQFLDDNVSCKPIHVRFS